MNWGLDATCSIEQLAFWRLNLLILRTQMPINPDIVAAPCIGKVIPGIKPKAT
jgi:hypothetical protein